MTPRDVLIEFGLDKSKVDGWDLREEEPEDE